MDKIRVIVEALAAGATAAAGPSASQAVREGTARLKALIQSKFGAQGDVAGAVEQVAKKPESEGRRHTLEEELSAAGAGQEAEVLQAARALLAVLQPKEMGAGQPAQADHGSAAAAGRSAAAVGNGNIQFTGDVQGGVTIVQGGWPTAPAIPPAAGAPVDTGGYDLQVVRDLLLAAFSAADLRRLFVYTSNPELRALTREFGPGDGLNTMVETVIQFCLARRLLPELLGEVERANARQYAHYAGRLRSERG